MHKEHSRRRPGAFLPILAIVTIALSLLSLPVWIETYTGYTIGIGIVVFELIELVVAVFLILIYIRTRAFSYTYCYINGEIIIEKVVGQKEIPVIHFRDSQIIELKRGLECNQIQTKGIKNVYRCYGIHDKRALTYIVYAKDEKKNLLIFTPTQTLFSIISQKTIDKQ